MRKVVSPDHWDKASLFHGVGATVEAFEKKTKLDLGLLL